MSDDKPEGRSLGSGTDNPSLAYYPRLVIACETCSGTGELSDTAASVLGLPYEGQVAYSPCPDCSGGWRELDATESCTCDRNGKTLMTLSTNSGWLRFCGCCGGSGSRPARAALALPDDTVWTTLFTDGGDLLVVQQIDIWNLVLCRRGLGGEAHWMDLRHLARVVVPGAHEDARIEAGVGWTEET